MEEELPEAPPEALDKAPHFRCNVCTARASAGFCVVEAG